MFKLATLAALIAPAWTFVKETGSYLRQDVGPFVGEKWYSGLVDMDKGDDMFYWWFEARNAPEKAPVVLWLTGGPGCASEIALFYENGPYGFAADGVTLK